MADPAEQLAMSDGGQPDAGFASLGLITPEELQAQRQQQFTGMLNQANAINPRLAIGLQAGNALQQGFGGMFGRGDPQMQGAQGNQQIIRAAQAASNSVLSQGGSPLDAQEAMARVLHGAIGSPQTAAMLAKVQQARVSQGKDKALTDEAAARAKTAGLEVTEVGIPDRPGWVQPGVVDKSTGKFMPYGDPKEKGGGISLSVDKGETAYDAKAGELLATNMGKMIDNGQAAASQSARYENMGRLVSDLNTGWGQDKWIKVANAAKAVGITLDPKLDQKNAAQALGNELALAARTAQGNLMPGSLSDSDRQFLTQMVPSLTNTPGGNKILLETMQRIADRLKAQGDLAADALGKHKKDAISVIQGQLRGSSFLDGVATKTASGKDMVWRNGQWEYK